MSLMPYKGQTHLPRDASALDDVFPPNLNVNLLYDERSTGGSATRQITIRSPITLPSIARLVNSFHRLPARRES